MFKHLFLFPFIGHFFTEFANSFCCSPPGKSKSGENSLLTKQKGAQSLYSTSNSKKKSRFDPAKPPPKLSLELFLHFFRKNKTPNKPTEPTTSMNPSINQASKQTTQTTKQLIRPVAQGPRSVYPCSWSVGRHRPRLSKRGVEGDPCDSDEAGEPPPWEIGDQSFGPNIPPRLFFVNVEIGDCLEVFWLEIGTKVRMVKVDKSSIK